MRQDIEAEQAVLGAVLSSESAHPALLSLMDTDFQVPKHRVIAVVLRDMIRGKAKIDWITVAAELRARNQMDTPGGVGGSVYLNDLVNFAPVATSATYYAEQVRKASRVRSAFGIAEELGRQLQHEDAAAELDGLLTAHKAKLAQIPPAFTEEEDDERDTVAALMAEEFGPDSWVIPGLLMRGERVVVTGGEGLSKTTLFRIMAICLAGGLNPWNGQRVSDGARVLYIDAENSRQQSHHGYNWIASRARRYPMIAPGWGDRIIHKTRNEGIDLPGKDAGWFHQVAAHHSPDVILLGPAYKLMRGDPQRDSDVLALLNVIDEVRVQHNAAVLVETHSPHGVGNDRPTRPYGSSMWLRWPEIGFGLRAAEGTEFTAKNRPIEVELVSWRGQREDRDWPAKIEHGKSNQLPWVPYDPEWAPSVASNYQIPEGEAA
jgi:hypothetical protein